MPDQHYSLYLAGPMTGRPDFNYPAFHAAAKRLRADPRVACCINPAEYDDGDTSRPYPYYIKRDALALLGIPAGKDLEGRPMQRAVAVLPGWIDSTGALAEVALAKALGYAILDAETLEPLDVEFAVKSA